MKYWNGWYRVEDQYGWDTWDWAVATYGPVAETGRWFYNHRFYYFKQERDAMLFTLARSGTEDKVEF